LSLNIFVILKENVLGEKILSIEEMKEKIQMEIINSMTDEIEINILQQKEVILNLGKELLTTFTNAKSNVMMFEMKSETKDEMQRIRKKYDESVTEVEKAMRLHRYVINNHKELKRILTGWFNDEHESLARINLEIEETFNRKELDKKDKDN
jgi:hypothetical protein